MLKNLRLRRPITFFDLETTGADPARDRIIEIACVRLEPRTKPRTLELRLNPEQPISRLASAIHGIRDEHVVCCPTFADRVKRIEEFFRHSDIAGFGIARFDLPVLVAEFDRCGRKFSLLGRKVIDAMSLFHRMEPRDLTAAVRKYCGREHEHAHRACQDVTASISVLDAMVGKHDELPKSVDQLHTMLIPVDVEGWFRREDGVIVFARGKHRDIALSIVARHDPFYLEWLGCRALPDARWHIEAALRIYA
ncbi:MAG: 3'-5' exonuclease [Gemmataceae bacterium]